MLSLGVSSEEDFARMKTYFSEQLLNQPEVLETWGGNRSDTPEEKAKLFERMDAWRVRAQAGQTSWYGIFATGAEGGSDQFLGSVGGYRYPDSADTAPFNGAVEMVWNIVPSEWGKGHGASAARAFMNSVVTDVYDFSYVYASALATNERSIRLAKSLGMDLWNIPAEMGKRPDYLDRRGKPIFRISRDALLG